MSECSNQNPAPFLILLLFIPLILIVSSNDNNDDSLLTDEQKLEKQKQLQEQQEIRDKEWDENVNYIVNSPMIYFPLLIIPVIGYKLYSSRYIGKTGLFMTLILTLMYGLYMFGVMDIGFNQFPLFTGEPTQ